MQYREQENEKRTYSHFEVIHLIHFVCGRTVCEESVGDWHIAAAVDVYKDRSSHDSIVSTRVGSNLHWW